MYDVSQKCLRDTSDTDAEGATPGQKKEAAPTAEGMTGKKKGKRNKEEEEGPRQPTPKQSGTGE